MSTVLRRKSAKNQGTAIVHEDCNQKSSERVKPKADSVKSSDTDTFQSLLSGKPDSIDPKGILCLILKKVSDRK